MKILSDDLSVIVSNLLFCNDFNKNPDLSHNVDVVGESVATVVILVSFSIDVDVIVSVGKLMAQPLVDGEIAVVDEVGEENENSFVVAVSPVQSLPSPKEKSAAFVIAG